MKRILKLTLLMLLVSVVLVGCINIPLGDGNKLKISTDGIVFTDEDGDETNIALDKDAGQLSVKGGKEGEEIDFTIGANVEIPDDFPSDIPLADDAMIIQSFKMNDGEASMSITYVTNDNFDSLSSLYDNFIKKEFTTNEESNKEEGSISSTDGVLYSLSGERNDGKLVVTILSYENTEDASNESDDYNATVTFMFAPNQE